MLTFSTLSEEFEALASDKILRTWWGLDEATVAQVQAALPALRRAHDCALSLDLPLLATHGDAQPLNALKSRGLA